MRGQEERKDGRKVKNRGKRRLLSSGLREKKVRGQKKREEEIKLCREERKKTQKA